MDWDHLGDEDETATAWHEAGHAVVGFALGGKIESVQLGGEADDYLPERFGDCVVNWGPVLEDSDWHRQREVMTVLAGPAGEMLHLQQLFDPRTMPPWQYDWQLAIKLAEDLVPDLSRRVPWLGAVLNELYQRMNQEPVRSAVAAVADELLTHEYLESDQLEETIGFWLRRARR